MVNRSGNRTLQIARPTEDLSIQVAHTSGMIQSGAGDTSAIRVTFVLDPKGILRAMVFYPMTT